MSKTYKTYAVIMVYEFTQSYESYKSVIHIISKCKKNHPQSKRRVNIKFFRVTLSCGFSFLSFIILRGGLLKILIPE